MAFPDLDFTAKQRFTFVLDIPKWLVESEGPESALMSELTGGGEYSTDVVIVSAKPSDVIELLEKKLEWNYRRLAGMESREKTFLAIINRLDTQRSEFAEKVKELQITVDMWESHVCGS